MSNETRFWIVLVLGTFLFLSLWSDEEDLHIQGPQTQYKMVTGKYPLQSAVRHIESIYSDLSLEEKSYYAFAKDGWSVPAVTRRCQYTAALGRGELVFKSWVASGLTGCVGEKPDRADMLKEESLAFTKFILGLRISSKDANAHVRQNILNGQLGDLQSLTLSAARKEISGVSFNVSNCIDFYLELATKKARRSSFVCGLSASERLEKQKIKLSELVGYFKEALAIEQGGVRPSATVAVRPTGAFPSSLSASAVDEPQYGVDLSATLNSSLFALYLYKGESITLDLTGKRDELLELYDAQGRLLLKDDDGGSGNNSRIKHIVQNDGYHFAVPKAYSGGAGASARFKATVKVRVIPPELMARAKAYIEWYRNVLKGPPPSKMLGVPDSWWLTGEEGKTALAAVSDMIRGDGSHECLVQAVSNSDAVFEVRAFSKAFENCNNFNKSFSQLGMRVLLGKSD